MNKETKIEYSELAFKTVFETVPGEGEIKTVRAFVDGRDLIDNGPWNIGYFYDNFFSQSSLMEGGFTAIGVCTCGVEGCGGVYVYVRREADQTSWTYFISPHYANFDFDSTCIEEELKSYDTVYFKNQQYDTLINNYRKKVESSRVENKTFATLTLTNVGQARTAGKSHTLQILIDGVDILQIESWQKLALASSRILAQKALLNGGYLKIGICCCGCDECGDAWVHVERSGDFYTWHYFVFPQDEDDVPPEKLNELPDDGWYLDSCKQHGPVYFKAKEYEAAIECAIKTLNEEQERD